MKKSKFVIPVPEFLSTVIMVFSLGIAILLKDVFPMMLNWFGIIFLFCSIYSWRSKTGEGWLSLYTIFVLFFVVFNYGQPLLWGLGIHSETEFGKMKLFYTNYTPSQQDIVDAQVYTCACMVIFHIGALVAAKRICKSNKLANVSQENQTDNTELLYALKTVSKVILFFEAPLAIGYSLYGFSISRVLGYKALYYGDYQIQSGYIPMLLSFFFPSLIGYMIGSNYSKRSRVIGYTIFIVYTIINVLSGDRGSWIYSLTILIWFHSQYRKISLKRLISIGIIGLLGLYVLQAIVNIRDLGIANITAEEWVELIKLENFPVFSAVFEMGGTMGIIMYLLRVGNGIYPYPNTYITAILGAVSSRLLMLFDRDVILLGDWFSQEYFHLTYGTGFSMIGEAYINGGYWGGLIYLFILGTLFGRLLGKGTDSFLANHPLRLFIMTAGMNALISFIRGALYLALKQFIWGVAIFAIIVMIFYNILRRKRI